MLNLDELTQSGLDARDEIEARFEHYNHIFKSNIKGNLVDELAKRLYSTPTTIYAYLAGKRPKYADMILYIYEGEKLLKQLKKDFNIYSSNTKTKTS